MATFEPIYRDVVSRLNQDTLADFGIRFYDIMRIINDEYRTIRNRYVTTGRGQFFTHTDDVFVAIPDFSYADFYYAELTYNVEPLLPVSQTIYASRVWSVTEGLKNAVASYNVGHKVIKNNKIYVCVTPIEDINSYTLTFNSNKVRNFKQFNGLKYHVGDVLFDYDTKTYWEVTVPFVADVEIILTDYARQVYWKEVQEALTTGSYFDFYELTRTEYFSDIQDEYAFSVQGNKIYTVKKPKRITISYIPEFVDVFDFDTEVILPSAMQNELKLMVLRVLQTKLGVGASSGEGS